MKIEFRQRNGDWDLRPSVYEITARDDAGLRRRTVQVYTEHAASFLRDPPKGIAPVDAMGAAPRDPALSEGATHFSYANAAHREIRLSSESELRSFVATLLDQIAQRKLDKVTPRMMIEYATQRYESGDREWLRFFDDGRHGAAWFRRVQRLIASRGEPG